MKWLIVLLLFLPHYSQAQLNQIGSTESQLRDYITKRGGCCEKTTYTNDGVKMIIYQFSISEPTGLLDAYFLMNNSGACYQCLFFYQNDDMVTPIVESARSNRKFSQIPGKLEFVNASENYYIKLTRENDNHLVVCYSTINNK